MLEVEVYHVNGLINVSSVLVSKLNCYIGFVCFIAGSSPGIATDDLQDATPKRYLKLPRNLPPMESSNSGRQGAHEADLVKDHS